VETVCTAGSFCEQGTKLENGACVPDCAELRRRGVECPSCGGRGSGGDADGDSHGGESTTPSPTSTSASGTGSTASGEGKSDGASAVTIVAVIAAASVCAGMSYCIYTRQTPDAIDGSLPSPASKKGTRPASAMRVATNNSKTDGFGFSGGGTPQAADDGYLEVDAAAL